MLKQQCDDHGFTVTELEAQRDQLNSEVNQLESEVASLRCTGLRRAAGHRQTGNG